MIRLIAVLARRIAAAWAPHPGRHQPAPAPAPPAPRPPADIIPPPPAGPDPVVVRPYYVAWEARQRPAARDDGTELLGRVLTGLQHLDSEGDRAA